MAKPKNQTQAPEIEAPAENPIDPVEAVAPADDAADDPVVTTAGPTVKGRVLRACVYGPCDAVVDIPVHQVEALAGVVDTHPDAVAYAESLRK